MSKDIIHFSHANGFPTGSYTVLLNCLALQYEVGYIDKLAHNQAYPVTDNWQYLADELIDFMQTKYDRPVIAVGHSLGGVLSYMVAKKRPDLVKQVILLDSPIMSKTASWVIKMSKKLNFIDRITPAGRTLGRQETWASETDAFKYFKDKSLFRLTDERCLKDYIKFATEPFSGGIRLTFDTATEINIFRTIPHNLHLDRHHMRTPMALIYGKQSNVVRPSLLHHARHGLGAYVKSIAGSHLFPLEFPEECAKQIHNSIEWLNEQSN